MIIYKVTNLINGKIYIGQDSKNNINYYGSGKIIIKAIKKYGKINFKKETLENCYTTDELNEREKYWIKLYNSQDKSIGYNILEGGHGLSPESKRKISEALKNKPFSKERKEKISIANKNRIFTKEHKEKISKNHADVSGEKNPMFGKKHSELVKQNSHLINLGRKASSEQKKRMSEKKQGENNKNSKLTQNQVIEIRRLYFEENFQKIELSKLFNVQSPCIYKIVNYLTWNTF